MKESPRSLHTKQADETQERGKDVTLERVFAELQTLKKLLTALIAKKGAGKTQAENHVPVVNTTITRPPAEMTWAHRHAEALDAALIDAIEASGGNQSEAARILGITRGMLRGMLHGYAQRHNEDIGKQGIAEYARRLAFRRHSAGNEIPVETDAEEQC